MRNPVRFILLFWSAFLLIPANAQDSLPRRPKIGLVLSGGAAKGIAHIGVLKVLEKAGIHVDYIAGTSMGSIVGGLYSIGYNADALENMVLSQDWMSLLGDEVNRRDLSVDEKDELGRYFVTFPMKQFRPKLPGGLKEGQNISMLLSRLSWRVHDISNFNQFPIPFCCVAADIATGEEVDIHSGHLPEALRASMAIPTVFTPVELDGHLLVDGGIVNDFPADQLKKMGADIIIGVYLGFRLHPKEDLHSISSIIEQAVFIRAADKNQQNKSLVNILIEPDVYTNFNAASFNEGEALIQVGEKAAMEAWPQLLALADSLKKFQPPPPLKIIEKSDSVYISHISLQGLKNVSSDLVLSKLHLDIPGTVTLSEIENAVNRIYGTQFFDKVMYKIDHQGNQNILSLNLVEKNYDLLRIGGRYDSDYNACLLINTAFRNYLIKGSKLSVDLVLGEFTRAKAEYTIHSAWGTTRDNNLLQHMRGLGIFPDMDLAVETNHYEIYGYENGIRTSVLQYSQSKAGIGFKSSFSNSVSLMTGADYEFYRIKTKVGEASSSQVPSKNSFLNLHGIARFDNQDHSIYPTRGIKLFTSAEYVTDLSETTGKRISFTRFLVRFNGAVPAGKKWTLMPALMAGYLIGDSIPAEYQIYGGGQNYSSVNPGFFPFMGRRLMEENGKTSLVASIALQYQFLPNQYARLTGNTGKFVPDPSLLIKPTGFLTGLGLTYGYDSPIGPLELSLMKAGDRSTLDFYINIGFWF